MSHGQVGNAIRARLADQVNFTGSVEAGKVIEQAAAGQFIGVGLELGGKDPAYVRADADLGFAVERSEEHTSELQSLMRISYAVFCLKKKKHTKTIHTTKRRRKEIIRIN